MEYLNIRSVNYYLCFIVTLIIYVISVAISQATTLDLEKEKRTLNAIHYKSLSLDEKQGDNAEILSEVDDQTFVQPSASWLLNEADNQLNDEAQNKSLFNSHSEFSKLYILAFQNSYEANFSRALAFKFLLSLIGGLGPIIPQFAIALRVGEYYNSSLLGYFLIATTALFVEGVTSWMIWELVEETQKLIKAPRYRQSNAIANNSQQIKGIGLGALCLILGALSSAPDVYKTYKYNEVKEFAIISFIYDTIPRTLGFYKLFSSLSCKSNSLNSEEHATRKRVGALIKITKAQLFNKCKENNARYVSESLENATTPKNIYRFLSLDSFESFLTEEALSSSKKDITKKIVQYTSLILPLASASFDMVLAYKGYSLFIKNKILDGMLSAFSVLPTFAFSSYVIMKASGGLFDKVYFDTSKALLSNYFSIFHPKINKAFICYSLMLGGATSIGGFYIISDNLEDTFLSPLKYVFSTLGIISGITFGTYTVYSSLMNFGGVTMKQCNKESAYILNSLEKLEDLETIIDNSDTESIKDFINEISSYQTLSI